MSNNILGMNSKKISKKQLAAGVMLSALGATGVQSYISDLGMSSINHVASAAEVASAVDTTKLNLAGFENAVVYDMSKLADPTGQTDSSEKFHEILGKSVDAPIILDLKGGYYKFDSTHNIEVIGSKGVKIIGEGATIDYLNAKTTNLPEFYAFQFHMKRGDNVGVQIDGVTFDGHRNEQNLFFTFNNTNLNGYGGDVSGFYKTRLAKGINITHAEDISVANTTFQNAYGGYSIIAEGYRHVNYENVKLLNVGGDGQTDSLGMGLYFGGHTFDDTIINMNNIEMQGKLGDGPQSNAGTGYSNPGDPSYTSWIGIVLENGSIQSTVKENWLEDKNTTLNVTNSTFNNVETTVHSESMAGNVAVNMNNVKTLTKQLSISAGIKGKYRFVGNKMDVQMLPYGRNSTYSSLFSAEFGDDTRYHNGYNANLTDANGGDPLHSNLLTNSKVNFLIRDKTPVGAPGSSDVWASLGYGNMVNANFDCVQFDNLWNKAYANAGGSITNSVINLWENNPNEATWAGIKGDPNLAIATIDSNTSINEAGAWQNLSQTCTTPMFNNFSGLEAPVLDNAVIPAPVGGGGTTPTTEAPTTEIATTEAPTTEAPTTEIATTEAPTTEAPTTEVATTEAPTTEIATTEAPTTEAPTTEVVTTEAPTTEAPTTEAPTTEEVTTEVPTTEAVTTENPDGTYSVKGKVFQDKNYDGLYDAETEGKVKNFKVVIKDSLGNVVKETETGSDGTYSIDGLKPGTYSLSFLAPTLEYSPSISNIDLDKSDDRDSDGPTDVRLVIENSSILNVDQGYSNIPANADVTDPTEPVTTEAPTTEAPTTEAPTTEVVTTEAPTTEAPTTEAPTTEVPTTEFVTTEAPTTEVPTTEFVTTEAPTTEAPNTKPELDVDSVDTELVEGGEFDALEGVSATDKEDGELTSKIKVNGEVDTTKPGEYEITYSVMDSDGEEVVKTVTVKVLAKETEEPTTESPTTESPTTEEVTTEDSTTEDSSTEEVTTEKVTTEINNNNNNNNNIGDNFPDDVKNPGDLPDTGNEQNKGLLAGGLGMLLAGLTVLGSKFRKFN